MICGTREYKQTNWIQWEVLWIMMLFDISIALVSSFSDSFGCLLFDLDFSKLVVFFFWILFEHQNGRIKAERKSGMTKSKHFCVSHHWSNNNTILKNSTKRKVTFTSLTRPQAGCEADGTCPRERRTTGVLFICVFSVLTTFRHTDSDTLTHTHKHTQTFASIEDAASINRKPKNLTITNKQSVVFFSWRRRKWMNREKKIIQILIFV